MQEPRRGSGGDTEIRVHAPPPHLHHHTSGRGRVTLNPSANRSRHSGPLIDPKDTWWSHFPVNFRALGRGMAKGGGLMVEIYKENRAILAQEFDNAGRLLMQCLADDMETITGFFRTGVTYGVRRSKAVHDAVGRRVRGALEGSASAHVPVADVRERHGRLSRPEETIPDASELASRTERSRATGKVAGAATHRLNELMHSLYLNAMEASIQTLRLERGVVEASRDYGRAVASHAHRTAGYLGRTARQAAQSTRGAAKRYAGALASATVDGFNQLEPQGKPAILPRTRYRGLSPLGERIESIATTLPQDQQEWLALGRRFGAASASVAAHVRDHVSERARATKRLMRDAYFTTKGYWHISPTRRDVKYTILGYDHMFRKRIAGIIDHAGQSLLRNELLHSGGFQSFSQDIHVEPTRGYNTVLERPNDTRR